MNTVDELIKEIDDTPFDEDMKAMFRHWISCSAEGFPNIRACFANKILKALCRQAGINKRVLVRECRGGTVLVKHYFKYELVSFHTARRSCITNLMTPDIDTTSKSEYGD